MYVQLFAAFFALNVLAAPQAAGEPPSSPDSDLVTIDGVQVDSAILSSPMLDIFLDEFLLNSTRPQQPEQPEKPEPPEPPEQSEPPEQQRVRREEPPLTTAKDASMMETSTTNRKGVFYRGDTRPPSVIFKEGFQPKGTDTVLDHHFRYSGESGFVSVSRSRNVARSYTTGHFSFSPKGGYVYVIAHNNVPDGYWLPGIYRKDGNVKMKNDWIDGAISTVQERIGGPQVPEIDGNELKLGLICSIRGKQRFKNNVDYACDRWRGDAPDEQPPPHPGRNMRARSINLVLDTCEKMDESEDTTELIEDAMEDCIDLINMVEGLAFEPQGRW
ncbi:hypothetical protein ACQRIT_001021 [Beauveria bassiana]